MLLTHLIRLADSLARASAGSNMLARMAMIAMTTSSSMSVKPIRARLFGVRKESLISLIVYPFIVGSLVLFISFSRPIEYFITAARPVSIGMTRKNWMLIAVAVLLGGLSLYLNKDWFAKDIIQISHRSRPPRGNLFHRRRADTGDEGAAINSLVFILDRKVKLTSLKVIPVSDIATNKYPHPIWHLVSDSNSVPIKDFTYCMRLPGMRPAVKDATPDPLEPEQKY